jgi:uncharacterized membrane protein
MKPFILLITIFALAVIISLLSTGSWNLLFGGNLAMSVMLLFTAIGHFKFAKGMTMMLPGFIPFRMQLVYLTGMAEIVLGLALLFPSFRHMAGIVLIAFFILMLPANIYAAIRHINYETATYNGKGIDYLWIRVPMQVLFILWVLYFSVRRFS